MRRIEIGLVFGMSACLGAWSAAAGADAVDLDDPASASQTVPQVAGPSFPCPAPRDPLAQLICSAPDLARLELTFVQSYQALRQQAGPAGQQAVRQEAVAFGLATRAACGIGPSLPVGATSPQPAPEAVPCVAQTYRRQKAAWDARLTGAAAEEAARMPEQQAALQLQLHRLRYIPDTDAIDGVFGSDTRAAIAAWQQASGREASGLLGNADAQALMRSTDDAAAASAGPAAAQTGTDLDAPTPPAPAPAIAPPRSCTTSSPAGRRGTRRPSPP